MNVVYETEERFKSTVRNLSLSPVANLAFILGTVGEEVYHQRLVFAESKFLASTDSQK